MANVIQGNHRVIDSPFATDAEAAAACRRIPLDNKNHTFARKMLDGYERYGPSLSDGKRYWLHTLAVEQAAREAKQAEAREQELYGDEPKNFDPYPVGRMERIANFMAGGANRIYARGLKTGARVTFESGEFMVSVHSTARDRTRWPGGFLVTGCTGFGKPNVPLAMIDANGWLHFADAGRLSPELHALLQGFEADPIGFAAEQGLKTGRCMFCRIELSDPISLTMGYGLVCSRHYALPWGKEEMAARRAKATPECVAV